MKNIKQIKQIYECKTLGVTVDQYLSWKSNYTVNICKKICAGIFADKETLNSIYNAIVRPYCDYCCEVWDVLGEIQSKRLQELQNRAARIILNISNDVNHTTALRALGGEPHKTERKKSNAKTMHEILNKMGPKSLTNLYSYKSGKTDRKRDISSSLCLPKPSTIIM